MTSAIQRVSIVGASLAGLHCAQSLRRLAPEIDITLVGDEHHLPYDRPPLSKQFLAGSMEEEKLTLRAARTPDEFGVQWRLGAAATGLNAATRAITIGREAGSLDADAVVIATGARARSLPAATVEGTPLGGVHTLRSLDDARAILAGLDAAPQRLVVIGAGFIGAEVAATARGRGIEVTMVEAAPSPMARVLDPASGAAIADLHRGHGVDVRLGVGVAGFTVHALSTAGPVMSDLVVSGVELADGSVIDADLVVIGIGVQPNIEWLADSGLTLDDGVVCDASCRAADGIYAAGDVARWPNERFGHEPRRVEQWDNAVEQAGYVARRLLADVGHTAVDDVADAFAPVPWFWSDQYDRKIQLAGVTGPQTEIVQGTIAEQRFVQLFCDADDRFVGALAWNRPRQAIQARQLLAADASVDEARATLAG